MSSTIKSQHKHRHGDTMVVVTVVTDSAIIDFADVLDATRVIKDGSNCDVPWEQCDGYDHTATPVRRLDGAKRDDAEHMRGYCWSERDRERVVVQLVSAEDFGLYDWHRQRGASRQVACEMVAAARRRTIHQLTDWYSDGWTWYGVTCQFQAGGQEYHDSIWGVDDKDYAQSLREEIAGNVAWQLEQAGYCVVGKPAPDNMHPRHDEYRRNLNSQNWSDAP